MPYSVMLDAGHGGRDPGAVYNGRQEKDDTLALVLAIGEILQNRGVDVEYTRTTDVYESPYQKAMEANAAGVDFFLSIHRNSYPTENTVSGVESLVYDKSGLKLDVAESIDDQLEAIGFVNLGVKARPGLVVLRRTQMPAVLVEAGFINSNTDNELFDANFNEIALAIAEGLLDVLESRGLIAPEYPDDTLSESNGQTTPTYWDDLPYASDERSDSRYPHPDVNASDQSEESSPSSGDSQPLSGIFSRNTLGNNVGNRVEVNAPQYTVQIGAYRRPDYARRLLQELEALGFPVLMKEDRDYTRVVTEPMNSLDDAAEMEKQIKRQGYPTVIRAD